VIAPGNVKPLGIGGKTEVNYLEVSMTGETPPPSPSQNSVEYAVIDMLATAAAQELSSVREQARKHSMTLPDVSTSAASAHCSPRK